MAQDLNFFIR